MIKKCLLKKHAKKKQIPKCHTYVVIYVELSNFYFPAIKKKLYEGFNFKNWNYLNILYYINHH